MALLASCSGYQYEDAASLPLYTLSVDNVFSVDGTFNSNNNLMEFGSDTNSDLMPDDVCQDTGTTPCIHFGEKRKVRLA